MKKLIKKILNLWNIYLSTIVSLLFSVFFDFSEHAMDSITKFLIMNLAFMSTLTFIKWQIMDKKPNTLIEKSIMLQPTIKTINTAIDPIESGKEFGKVIIETTNIIERVEKNMWNKIKKVASWVKTYWQQLVGLAGAFVYAVMVVYAFITDRFGWLLKYFPEGDKWELGIKIGVGFISSFFVFFLVRNQVKWCGVGSIKTAQKYLETIAKVGEGQISPRTKANIQNAVKVLKTNLKTLTKKVKALELQLEDIKDELTSELELLNLGVGDNVKYQTLLQDKAKLEAELSKIETTIHNSETSIAKYNDILAVKIL